MPYLRSLRFQASVVAFFGVCLPYVLLSAIRPSLHFSVEAARFTLFGSMAAAVWAVVFARRFTLLPFRINTNLSLPTFAIVFGIAATLSWTLKIPSSVILFISLFVSSILTYLVVTALAAKFAAHTYYIVPGGRVQFVAAIADLNARTLSAPDVPNGKSAIIIADLHHDHADEWERMLADAALKGVPVFHAKHVWEEVNGRILIEHLSENTLGTIMPNMPWLKLKRMIDLLVTIVAMPLLVIPMLLISALIKFDSPGPALFRQVRVGYRGNRFHVVKFRTMHCSAPHENAEALDLAKTKEQDNRITKVGRFLRSTRLDELPQILNILRGEMSWIGPRPEAEPLSEWYEGEIPFYSYRHIIRPGISGWAQVNQGHVTEIDDIHAKLQYDFYYIRNLSPWLDVVIVFRTVWVIVTGFGHK